MGGAEVSVAKKLAVQNVFHDFASLPSVALNRRRGWRPRDRMGEAGFADQAADSVAGATKPGGDGAHGVAGPVADGGDA
ncbi:hypothetical protein Ato02nite_097440 [Paractinoplanes toevensis]|uniref:Uncharacterized protein n=1 Tax=Paractinoplanes toevensis TaxID=571911 RepID=A0A920BRT6_9ACTN|nr:hypothetical protein Ato02nite_097440 [Actinoplanes toevensis]